MKNRKPSTSTLLVMMTALLSLAGGPAFAVPIAPMTPEMAAKREMVRKQQSQRITPEKRTSAAAALKAERVKIYQAKQEARKLRPIANENK